AARAPPATPLPPNTSGNACVPGLGPQPGLHPRRHTGHLSAPVATVLGSALLVVAFAVDRSLRSSRNFFPPTWASGFCIPLSTPYVLTREWTFRKQRCKLWLVTDYLVCTPSVFDIVLISCDRFTSVTRAVRRAGGMTRNIVSKMVLVWVVAFLFYGPAIIGWEYVAKRSLFPWGECSAEFFYN
uniref:G-protein coupled receptors family 1 profile domain-containing protein n=1 Tax=Suricata suricatta TaxID=37032 RepID=A0A673ULG0_SURSU